MDHDHILPDQPGDEWLDRFCIEAHTLICKRQRGTLTDTEMFDLGSAVVRTAIKKADPALALKMSDALIVWLAHNSPEIQRRTQAVADALAARLTTGS
jgi:hypothetical protein